MQPFLNLPQRAQKPRSAGITAVIDQGLPTAHFRDVVESHANLIDYVKFGWGTALVTKDLAEKVKILNKAGIGFFFGGTLFEKALAQNKVDDFFSFCEEMGCSTVEISDGTLEMTQEQKCGFIKKFAKRFTVFSEVGYKDPEKSINLFPSKWIEFINTELEAGATKVITEARETGSSGICRANGELRFGLIEEIAASGIDSNKLIFEAPNKTLQTYFIKRFSSNVNLGNIQFSDVVPLETLRVGLRSDTLTMFG